MTRKEAHPRPMRTQTKFAATLVLSLAVGLFPVPARAEEAAEPDRGEVSVDPAEGSEKPEFETGAEERTTGEPKPDPCSVPRRGTQEWYDWVHDQLFERVCSSSRWFDGFFGDTRYDEELRRTHGRASVDMLWDEYDGWDNRVRLRVKWPLKNFDRRVDAFFGRDDDVTLTDRDRGLDLIPGPFADTRDEEWLVGLGYRAKNSRRKGDLDFKVGAKLHFPVELLFKGRYWRRWFLDDSSLVRFTETVFWRNELGFGSTTNLEYESFVGRRMLFRWRNTGTVAEKEVNGWEWSSNLTLYHGLTEDHALAYQAIIRGETKDPVPLEEYGFSITYRQRILREWFFYQVRGGVTWPREERWEARDASPHVGFGIEIEFDRGSGRPGANPETTATESEEP